MTKISVNPTRKTRLFQALSDAGIKNPASVTGLTITGMFTGEDMRYIGKNIGENLRELDISNVLLKNINNICAKDTFTEWLLSKEATISEATARSGWNFLRLCTGLRKIKIPDAVTFEFSNFLLFCDKLINIDVNSQNRFYTSENGVLFNKEKTKLILYPRGRNVDYVIPNSVKEIDNHAFFIPASAVKLDTSHFYSPCPFITVHPDNPHYTSVNGVVFSKDMTQMLFFPIYLNKKDYVLPVSVKEIDDKAFCRTGFIAITKPYTVVEINPYFWYCELTSIVIPQSVIKIGENTFKKCFNLIFIDVHPDNPAYTSENGVLFNKDKSKLIKYPFNKQQEYYAVPDSVVEIVKNAFFSFYETNYLKSLFIPASVKKFDDYESLYRVFITVHPDNPTFKSVNGEIKRKKKRKTMNKSVN